ncbi:hypothetical protein CVT25_008404 [Psilocybe cyanescens]|uniref:Proline dehydrogenase n=1 Tax=Psilocybe cyanescens TaxID=93625 RepID=A0A409VQG8_PSICY|nr:hypothetical protein CVT25_008404 [Psilocybe cyanescens]
MLRAGFGVASNLSKPRFRLPPANWNTRRAFASAALKNKNVTLTLTRRGVARTVLFTLTAAASSLFLAGSLYADHDGSEEKSAPPPPPPPTSLGSLVRAYAVYSMCSVPALVDASPKLLSTLSSIPGVRQITEAFVRVTFFDQFVGADSAEDAVPLLYTLRAANQGVLFAYSVEVDENEATGASFSSSSSAERVDSPTPSSVPHHAGSVLQLDSNDAPHKRIVDEMLHCIDVAADFEAGVYDEGNGNGNGNRNNDIEPSSTTTTKGGKRTWVAVKMTALLPDAHALIALSSHIVDSKKTLSSVHPEGAVPFPGAARMEDLDVLAPSQSSPLPPVQVNFNPARTPGMTSAQIRDVRELYADLRRICVRARERGVKVIVDAEYSWYQPAIDALTLALMREFNSLDSDQNWNRSSEALAPIQPLVYGTFQAYLRRTPKQLSLALADARAHNYALGVKLVRGAYHPHEITAHDAALAFDRRVHGDPSSINARPSLSISPDVAPPVWTKKRDTDEQYDKCVRVLIEAVREDVAGLELEKGQEKEEKQSLGKSRTGGGGLSYVAGWVSGLVGAGDTNSITTKHEHKHESGVNAPPRIGVLFGTHNWDSCALILKELVRNGLAVELAGVEGEAEGGHNCRRIKVGKQVVERVAIGQLYGMSDDLTDWVVSRIASSTPFVIKFCIVLIIILPFSSVRYVPYGALADVRPLLSIKIAVAFLLIEYFPLQVMPYLSRRAIENKSVLGDGNAQHERDRARQEIWKRLFG